MTPEIKKALDLALDRAVPSIQSPGWVMIPDKDFDAIKQAIAAPTVQEPVAWREALERIADPRNTHFAGDAQVVAREALATPPAAPVPEMVFVPYEPCVQMQEQGSAASDYDLSQSRSKRVYQAMLDMHQSLKEKGQP